MKSKQVVEFYGGVRATARALGLVASTVCQWGEEVPASRQQHVRLAMEAEEKARADRDKKEARREARKARDVEICRDL